MVSVFPQTQGIGDRRKCDRHFVVEKLQEWGLVPLPVAPSHPVEQYPAINKRTGEPTDKPKFTGKNPSYLSPDGTPHLVWHPKYRWSSPSEKDLEKWFTHSETGIGTLGTKEILWIDFDAKHFGSSEDCQTAVEGWLNQHNLHHTLIQRTPSGGYRVGVKVRQNRNGCGFNFSLSPKGPHCGEVLGYGKFTVLWPTQGYESLNFAPPVEIESLESIGIYTAAKTERLQRVQSTDTFRLHAGIVFSGAWSRLWYFLRANDAKGTGFIKIAIKRVLEACNAASSTVYQWLRQGRKVGAFREYRVTDGELKVFLGGLCPLTASQGLGDFGAVSQVPKSDFSTNVLKQLSTHATTQQLQERSRFAAKRDNPDRELIPTELLLDQTDSGGNHKNASANALKSVVHRSRHKVFVNGDFVRFGTTQAAIAESIGRHERTVRRHLRLKRKQVLLTKPEYTHAPEFLKLAKEWLENPRNGRMVIVDDIESKRPVRIDEGNWLPIHQEQFFRYRGTVYRNCPNIYAEGCELTSMRAARQRLAQLIAHKDKSVADCGGVGYEVKTLFLVNANDNPT